MSSAIGLAIECDRVRAVAVRRGRVQWGVEGAIDPDQPLTEAVAAFLVSLPTVKWPRADVTVALGGAFAQMKRLAGLPPIGDEWVLTQTVQEHVGRFFLKNGVPLVTTSVRIDTDGNPWAAALDQTVVAAVESACRAARLRLQLVVPAADVIGRGLRVADHATVVWDEPGARVRLTWVNGQLTAVARIADDEDRIAGGTALRAMRPEAAPALAILGAEAWRFAAAYGAALTGAAPIRSRSATLVWHGGSSACGPLNRRLALAAGAVGFGIIFALATPGIAARRAERSAKAHLATVNGASRMAERTQRDLDRVTLALGEMATFGNGTRSATNFMAALTRVLPSGAVLVTLHVDSVGGSIVVLAPHAGEVLARVATMPGVISLEVVGSVERETVTGNAASGRELERATLRFRWSP